MECSVVEIPGMKERLALIGQTAVEAGKLLLFGDKDAAQGQIDLLINLMRLVEPKEPGIKVFKDGKDITHRCKVTESNSVTVDIGCDLDEAILRVSDPTGMQNYYMFRRDPATKQGDTVRIQLPRFVAEIMNRVLPGSFSDNQTLNP